MWARRSMTRSARSSTVCSTGRMAAACCISSARTCRCPSIRGSPSTYFRERMRRPRGEVLEDVLQPHTFSVLDVENLRLHYARTLALWLERFEDQAETIARM